MDQTSQIIKHLKSGGSITAMQALRKYGIYRLAARIHNIRSDPTNGMDVISELVQRNGKRIAIYHGVREL